MPSMLNTCTFVITPECITIYIYCTYLYVVAWANRAGGKSNKQLVDCIQNPIRHERGKIWIPHGITERKRKGVKYINERKCRNHLAITK